MTKQPLLIVEDEAIMREALTDWLGDVGYDVATAQDGEQALDMLGEQDFALLILDLKLPGIDGLQVLKQARTKRPGIKAIIITAYPAVETAVEAIKVGATDYLPKPFTPERLEEVIRETLGPLTVKIGPKTHVEAPRAETREVVVPVVEEAGVITPAEAPTHLDAGKALYKEGRWSEALQEFEAVRQAVPGNIEARIWIGKAKAELEKPKVELALGAEVAEGVKPKQCVWMRLGVVAYRLCTRDYQCLTCDFDQQMQAQGESPEIAKAMERLKEMAGVERLCRYALRGEVSYRLCSRLYQCANCAFDQAMQDAVEEKLAKLEARRQALKKKEERPKVTA